MKPLYYKLIERSQESFIKVVRSGAYATAGIITRLPNNAWTNLTKLYNLHKKQDQEDYAILIENCLESSRTEYDEASSQLLNQIESSLRQEGKTDSNIQ